MTHHHPGRCAVAFLPLLAVLASAAAAQEAGEPHTRPIDRRFAYATETLHGAAVGHHEFEQWFTYAAHSDADHGYRRLDVQHEFEYGLSERVHVGVDLAEWHWEHEGGESHTRFDATAAEVKVRLLDPRTEPVGLAWKTELGVGPVGLEWENVAVVDKYADRLYFAYNLRLEAGWGGDKLFEFRDGEGELGQVLAVSRELQPALFVGAEMLHEVPLPDWHTGAHENLFLGPNVAIHGHEWALTATALGRLAGGDDEPLFQVRVIFELDF